MKQITTMATLGVLLLAGVSSTALANGHSAPQPEPARYTPPPPPPSRPLPPPPPPAEPCEEGMYISAAIGIGIPEELKTDYDGDFDMDTGIALNGAIGYNFGSARLEAAIGYQQHELSDYDDEDVSLLTVMANAYYDIETGSDVRPYIMGGIGIANADMSWTSEDDTVFAWQLGVGLGVKVADCTTLDLGYRYLKPSNFDTDGAGDAEWSVHNIMLGLRYQF